MSLKDEMLPTFRFAKFIDAYREALECWGLSVADACARAEKIVRDTPEITEAYNVLAVLRAQSLEEALDYYRYARGPAGIKCIYIWY